MYVCANDNDALLYSHLTTCFFSLLDGDNVRINHVEQNGEGDDSAKKMQGRHKINQENQRQTIRQYISLAFISPYI